MQLSANIFSIVLMGLFLFKPSYAFILENKINLKKSKLETEAEITKARELIRKVQNSLPDSILNGLPEKLEIRFFTDKKFAEPTCQNRLERKPVKTKRHSYYKRKRIYINKNLLDYIGSNKKLTYQKNGKTYSCSHGDLNDFVISSIYHEFFHAYDSNAPKVEKNEMNKIKGCKAYGSSNVSKRCNKMYKNFRRKNRVSDDLLFKSISLWHGKKKKSFKGERVTDFDENENIKDYAATNFEYFMLDKEYKCRRPSHYEYYKRSLKAEPNSNYKCDSSITAIVAQKGFAEYDFDPTRLYQIDYALTEAADAFLSPGKFGHSALRLTFCRKGVEFGPRCLLDRSNQFIVDYRANVHDLMTNSLKGLVGKYASKLFIYHMDEFKKQYKEEEIREVYFYPLKLGKVQRTRLLAKILEDYWEYKGSYRFITKNCATEAFDLIASSFPRLNWMHVEGNITPMGVLKDLVKLGVVDKKYFNGKKKGNLPNIQYSRSILTTNNSLIDFYERTYGENLSRKKIKKFMKRSSAEDRLKYIQEKNNTLKTIEEKISFVEDFQHIEDQILVVRQKNLRTAQTKALIKLMKEEKKMKIEDRLTKTTIRDLLEKSEQDFISNSYGIPSNDEIKSIQNLVKVAIEEKTKVMPSLVDEMKARKEKLLEMTKNEQKEVDLIERIVETDESKEKRKDNPDLEIETIKTGNIPYLELLEQKYKNQITEENV